jgi:hypothetical protein
MNTIKVHEEYKNFTPLFEATPVIRKLLSTVPPHFLSGLKTIIATNSNKGPLKKSRIRFRGRKLSMNQLEGLYRRNKNKEAWIELYLDNIFNDSFTWAAKYRPVQEVFLAETLFHEIGHHIDHTVGGHEQNSESAAEKWRRHLIRQYVRKHYWYWLPFLRIAHSAWQIVKWFRSIVTY